MRLRNIHRKTRLVGGHHAALVVIDAFDRQTTIILKITHDRAKDAGKMVRLD